MPASLLAEDIGQVSSLSCCVKAEQVLEEKYPLPARV